MTFVVLHAIRNSQGTTIKHHYMKIMFKLNWSFFCLRSHQNGKHKNHFPASKIKNHGQEKYLIFIRFFVFLFAYIFLCIYLFTRWILLMYNKKIFLNCWKKVHVSVVKKKEKCWTGKGSNIFNKTKTYCLIRFDKHPIPNIPIHNSLNSVEEMKGWN